jgi:hypothetical protein
MQIPILCLIHGHLNQEPVWSYRSESADRPKRPALDHDTLLKEFVVTRNNGSDRRHRIRLVDNGVIAITDAKHFSTWQQCRVLPQLHVQVVHLIHAQFMPQECGHTVDS